MVILQNVWRQCNAESERLAPYQSEDPSPTIPTHRKKEEKGKNSITQNGTSSLDQ